MPRRHAKTYLAARQECYSDQRRELSAQRFVPPAGRRRRLLRRYKLKTPPID
ncbi:MAG: hypothetical protein Q4A64_07310 [Porphyromonadaceae bacterium]|nr:hypothetical protein [Porphyromonadaceae bacterium]